MSLVSNFETWRAGGIQDSGGRLILDCRASAEWREAWYKWCIIIDITAKHQHVVLDGRVGTRNVGRAADGDANGWF